MYCNKMYGIVLYRTLLYYFVHVSFSDVSIYATHNRHEMDIFQPCKLNRISNFFIAYVLSSAKKRISVESLIPISENM